MAMSMLRSSRSICRAHGGVSGGLFRSPTSGQPKRQQTFQRIVGGGGRGGGGEGGHAGGDHRGKGSSDSETLLQREVRIRMLGERSFIKVLALVFGFTAIGSGVAYNGDYMDRPISVVETFMATYEVKQHICDLIQASEDNITRFLASIAQPPSGPGSGSE